MLSGRGLCDELITRPEESYRLCCVVVCDVETSRMGAPYIYDISRLRVNEHDDDGNHISLHLHYVFIMSSLLYLSNCNANVLRILDGQTDEAFALRVHFTKELQRLRVTYRALVTSSNLRLVTHSDVNGDGDNSCKGVGSAGTAWKIIELLGI